MFTAAAAAQPSTLRRAWYVVGLLCLIACISYLDRYVIALLADPIMKGMGIGATHIGLLIGLGFGLLYSVAGVPIAHLLDRGRRVRIVGLGVLVWSACTVASGFAPNYELLLLSRAGVAIGEAVLVPATVSLVADLFPSDRRTLPISLFMAVSAVMGSGAFLLGGLVYDLSETLVPTLDFEAWRSTLVIVGLPGLLLAPLWLFTVDEPERTSGSLAAHDDPTVAAALRYLSQHKAYYGFFLFGIGISAIGSYSFIAWTSTVLVRSFGRTVAEAGAYFGTIGVVSAVAAAIFWPMLSNVYVRRGKPQVAMLLLTIGLGLGHSMLAAFALVDSMLGASIVIAVATFGFASAGALAVLIIQSAAPSRMRAKITSLYVLIGNLIGLTCGPALSAWISEWGFSGPDAMRMSLATIGALLAPATALSVYLATSGYKRAYREVNPGGL